MNANELAAILDGRGILNEITKEEAARAKADGLIVIFGYSDDCIELRGAICNEVGGPGDLHLHRGGIVEVQDHNGCLACEATLKAKAARCATIRCLWDHNDFSWWIEPVPGIPYSSFSIMEGGEPFCRGIVLAVADLPDLSETPAQTLILAAKKVADAVDAYRESLNGDALARAHYGACLIDANVELREALAGYREAIKP